MNIIALTSLLSFIIFIFLGHFIYYENKKDPLNRTFAALCVFLSLWSFSEYMYRHMPNANEAHMWIKISALFWTIPSAIVVHFALVFSKQKFLRKKINYLFIYLPAVIFSFIDFTTNLMTSNQPVKEFGGYAYVGQEGSLFYWIGNIWAIGMAALGVALCVQYYFRTYDSQKRKQAKYISIGLSIPIIGTILILVSPFFKNEVPDITTSLATMLAIFVGYAIWKYGLFEMDPTMAAENIFRIISDLLILLDKKEKIIYANNAALKILEYQEYELLGKHVSIIFEDKTLTKKLLSVSSKNYDTYYLKKSGQIFPVLFSSSVIKDKMEIKGVVLFGADITKRKEAEIKIEKQQQFTLSLIEGLPDGFTVVDREGKKLLANDALGNLTGFSKKELMNMKRPFRYWSEEGLKDIQDAFEKTLQGIEGDYELMFKKKNGERFIALVSPRKTKDPDGNVIYFAIIKDITQRKRVEVALEKSEKKYRILAEAAHDAIFIIDRDGYFRYVNAFTANQLGSKPEEMINKPMSNFFPPEVVQRRLGGLQELFIQGEPFYTEERTPISGKTIWTGTWLVPIMEKDGKVKEVLGVARDITDRKKMEEALKESEQKLSKISDSAYDAIVMINDEEQILYWNKAAELIFGYSREEALGKKVHSLIMPEKYLETASKGFQNFKTTGRGRAIDNRLELSGLKKDGTEFPIELSLSSVKIKEKWNAIGLMRDITERKKAEEEIKHMAYYDSLTGLPNRKLFGDRFGQTLANAQRNKHMFAVMFIDLDGFKIINDKYGHEVGDSLLKKVGKRFVQSIRQIDTVARMGGDEFAIILSRMNKVEDAKRVADKIIDLFSESFKLNGHDLTSTASIGISIFPIDGRNMTILLSHADIAMYRAKGTGKNKYQFYFEISQQKAA